jgi:hypothetical protein
MENLSSDLPEVPLSPSSWTDLQEESSILPDLYQIPSTTIYEWNRATSLVFLSWWKNTTWYCSTSTSEYDPEKHINFTSVSRISKSWAAFHQGAKIGSGEPVLVCKNCKASLVHPGIKKTGTSSLKTHVLSTSCQRRSYAPQAQRQTQISFSSFSSVSCLP